uniref:Uncharacterized protein n=1 Tax=uncultured marine group II/III euryarchaeote KM3_35_H09 TaxID=1456439 RepID=A0A075H5S8_9EURY|nr:hypothetical protein [uncultured marine group II/III euryarchaeote KM3_35_H09]
MGQEVQFEWNPPMDEFIDGNQVRDGTYLLRWSGIRTAGILHDREYQGSYSGCG